MFAVFYVSKVNFELPRLLTPAPPAVYFQNFITKKLSTEPQPLLLLSLLFDTMNIVEQVLQNIAMEEDALSKEAVPTSSPPPLPPTAANSWPSAPPQVTSSSSSTSSNPSSVHDMPPGIVTPIPQARTPQHHQSISRTVFSNGKDRTYPKSNTNSSDRDNDNKFSSNSAGIERHRQRQHQRLKYRQGGILDKTADHLERRRQRTIKATETNNTFKPDISEYSRQLKRNEPVHQRLFRVGQKNLEKKRERIIHDSKYDWESGKRLFHPKTNKTHANKASGKLFKTSNDTTSNNNNNNSNNSNNSNGRKDGGNSIIAGNRLYRNALHSRAKLREKQIAELVMQERQRHQVRMSPQSRQFARKKVERELRTVYQRLNTSGSGLLTFDELSGGMASVHINLPPSAVEENDNDKGEETLSMPDMVFWDRLTLQVDGLVDEQRQQQQQQQPRDHVDLVTFLSVTYHCLRQADPAWIPLTVVNRSLTASEVIVTWCRAWMEALAIGGKTPYGHVQPGDGRHRWKQRSQSALGTEYNDFSGGSYRERKSKLAYESPDDRECTFKPKLTKHSRELDRKRMGIATSTGGSGTGGENDAAASRVALMLMLHQRKEDKLNIEREKQLIQSMKECTFSPAIKHSSRTLRMVRKSMDDSDRNRFSGDTDHGVPAFIRLHDQHEEHRKKKYKELTSEQREWLDYCTFQPNLQLRQGELERQKNVKNEEYKHSACVKEGETGQGDTKTNDDDILANFALSNTNRMPWESAATGTTPKTTPLNSMSSSISTKAKGGVTVHELKTQTRTFFAAGVHDHTARIRNARQSKKEKERELQMMGKSTDYVQSLRMDSPPLPTEIGKKKRIDAFRKKVNTAERKKDNDKETDLTFFTPQTKGKVSIPPALRMRVQAADGGSQTIEIYAGDSPAVVAATFSNMHSLDTGKTLKLQQLIAAHMAKNQIPMSVA